MACLETPLTKMLGIKYPIMLAGMGGVSGKKLVAAVSNAGGYGVWGSAVSVKDSSPAELRSELEEIRIMCGGRPFGVDLLVYGAAGGVMKELIQVFAESGATAFISGRGFPRAEVVAAFHAQNMLVGSVAGKVEHAIRAVEAGVDFVIAQGSEGGGHTGTVASSVLIPQTVDAVGSRVPVIAAGGIFDGRGLAASIMYGATGVWVGTRFLLTHEARSHQLYKEHIVKCQSHETTVSRAFTGFPLRVLKNAYTNEHARKVTAVHSSLQSIQDGVWTLHSGKTVSEENAQETKIVDSWGKIWPLSKIDMTRQAFVCGQCVGPIQSVQPAAQVVREMADTAIRLLAGHEQAKHLAVAPVDTRANHTTRHPSKL